MGDWGTHGGAVFPAARINNCLMSSGGWPNDSGHYGCADPSFILAGCSDVHWDYNGPMGYGWYCLDGGKEPTYYEPQSGNKIEYYPDLYKFEGTDDWSPYVNSCIHLSCDDSIGIGY